MVVVNQVVTDASTFPWSAVAWVVSRFPDGAWATGSGALVGPNDVLTASHVLYSAANGGAALEVRVYPGADPGTEPGRFLSGRAIDFFPVDPDGDNRLGAVEVPYDFALVSLGERLPESLGRFHLDPDLYEAGEPLGLVSQSGYSGEVLADYNHANEPDAMAVQGFSTGFLGEEPFAPVWDIRDLAVEPGDSGSPIWVEDGGRAYVVGVVSTEPWAAPIDRHADNTLSAWIAGNDHLMDETMPGPVDPDPGRQPVAEVRLDLVEAAVLVFGAAPGGHMETLVNDLEQAGSRAALMEAWTDSALFQAPQFYPEHLGAEPFVARLLERAVDGLEVPAAARDPVQEHYVTLLQGAGRGAVLTAALGDLEAVSADHPEWGPVSQQFSNRVDVAAYYTLERAGDARDVDFLQALIEPVTDDPATVTAALETIDGLLAHSRSAPVAGQDTPAPAPDEALVLPAPHSPADGAWIA